MADLHKNFAYSTVATAPAPATTGTSLVVQAGNGSLFPVPPFNATVWPTGANPTSTNSEIVRVTAIASDTLTIIRTQEATAARTIVVTDQIAAGVTAKTLTDIETTYATLLSPALTGSPTSPTQLVTDSSTAIATDQFVQNVSGPSQISTLTVIGHSWTASSNADGAGTPQFNQQNMIPRLMGLLGVHEQNLTHLGTGASFLCKTNAVFGGTNTGWGGVLQFIAPYSSPINADVNILNITVPVPPPSAFVIVHGVNDIGVMGANTTATTYAAIEKAYKNTLRSVISRVRAGVLYGSYYASGSTAAVTWDPTISTSGFVSTPQTASNTGVAIYRSSTNANTITWTIPANFMGGKVAMCFLGNGCAWSQLNTIMNATDASDTIALTQVGGTPYQNFLAGDVLAVYSGGVDSGERMLITAGAGTASITVTRGFNATTKTTHAVGDEIIKASSIGVTFSTTGSNGTISGTLALGAMGLLQNQSVYGAERIPVVKRFVLTAADAGKTITATVNTVASDTATVDFDSVWIEAFDPQPCVVANLPQYAYASNANVSLAQMQSFNAAIAAAVAEFDSAVQVADLNTTIYNRGGTLISSILISATSFNVTAINSTILASLSQNSTFAIEGERMLVGTITNNGGGSFTFSNVTRGYDGTAAAAHTAGKIVSDGLYFHTDSLHLNGYGHNVAANLLYAGFKAFVGQTPYSLSTGAGNNSDDRRNAQLGLANGSYYTFAATNFSNTLTPFNTQYFMPVYIPQTCIISQIGSVVTTTGATASTCRFGLYDLDAARRGPSTLWHDFGTVSTIGTGFTAVNTYKLVRPGWYYVSVCEQGSGTASTKRGTNTTTALNGYAGPNIATTTTPVVAYLPTIGFTSASVTGAFPAAPASLVEINTSTGFTPFVWIKVLTRTWA